MKTNVTISVVAAIVLLAGLGQANATILYSTTPSLGSTGGQNLTDGYYQGSPFTIAAGDVATSFGVYVVSSVKPSVGMTISSSVNPTPGAISFPISGYASTAATSVDATTNTNDWLVTFPMTPYTGTGAQAYLTIVGGTWPTGTVTLKSTTTPSPGRRWDSPNPLSGDRGNSTDSTYALVINGTLAADVPEPATMSLLVLGGIATLIRRRNRRA